MTTIRVLHAHASRENVGDDAIVLAIHQLLAEWFSGSRIEVTSVSSDDIGVGDGLVVDSLQIRSIHQFRNCAALYEKLEQCDFVVIGGGELVCGAMEYMLLLRVCSALNIPVYLIGIGSERSRMSRIEHSFTARTLRLARAICVRDSVAFDEINSMTGESANIVLSSDVVFSYYQESIEQSSDRAQIERNGLGLILRSTQRQDRQLSYLRCRNLVSSLVQFCKDNDQELHLYPFVPNDPENWQGIDQGDIENLHLSRYSDGAILELIRDWVGTEISVTLHDRAGLSVDKVLREFSSLKYVVSMRLHGLILASIAGTPSVGIDYANKITRVMKEVGRESTVLSTDDLDDATNISSRIATSLSDPIQRDTLSLKRMQGRLRELPSILDIRAEKVARKDRSMWSIMRFLYAFTSNRVYALVFSAKGPLVAVLLKTLNVLRRRKTHG